MADGRSLYVILSANAAGYKAALRGAENDTNRFGRSVDDAGRKVDTLTVKTGEAGKEVDKLSGRLRIALDVLALIGPAAVPLTAVAIPALSGMAAQLGIMAVTGGAVMLAFVGIGDAVKAVEEASLDPTAANLEKMRQAMSKLPADAREFVEQIRDLRPLLDQIRDASASGFFGANLTDELDELRNNLPQVERLLFTASRAAGDMAEKGLDAFNSDQGRIFLRFLTNEARPTIETFASTMGNLLAGAGNMWRGFDPISDDFGSWLLGQSEDFRAWSREMNESDGYRDLFDYIRENGPQVADTLGAIGGMTLDLVQAAAPLGGPALAGIELFADAVAKILDSPIGPSLLAGAAALTILNRGLQLTTGLLGKLGMESQTGRLGGSGGALDAMSAKGRAASSTFATLRSDIRAMSREYQRAAVDTKRVNASLFSGGMFGRQGSVPLPMREKFTPSWSTVTTGQGQRGIGRTESFVRSALSQTTTQAQRGTQALKDYAKGAATAGGAVAALAVLSTESGRELGVNNTALLALTGSMAGPWGAAIGAGVGGLLDLVSAGKKATATLDDIDQAMKGTDGDTLAEQIRAARAELEDLKNVDAGSPADIFQMMGNDLRNVWGGDFSWDGDESTAEREAALAALEQRSNDVANAQIALGKEVGILDSKLSYANVSAEDWAATLELARPAMDALGISAEDLYNMDSSELEVAADRIRRQITYADSGKGRMDAYGASVADLANDMLSTADSAAAMSSALEALLKPSLDLEAATDAWRASLAELEEKLKSGAGFKGFSDAAMENRDLTRSYAEDVMGRLTALAGVSTTTEEDMAVAVRAAREEFIKSGMAAGFSREEIVARAKALGLTPKLVQTTFEAAGITQYDLKVRAVKERLKTFPKRVRTAISAEGIPETSADVDALVEKYDLTEKERKAVVAITDLASGPMREILLKLLDLGRQKPTPAIGANTAAARAEIELMRRLLRELDGTSATTYVYTRRRTIAETTPGHMGPQPMDGSNPPPPPNPTNPRIDYDGRRSSQPAGRGAGGGGTTLVEAPTIGNLTVPAMPGASLEDVDNTAAAVVRAASLARRSGRWKKRR